MKNVLRNKLVRLLFGLICVAWLLTLGIFVESGVKSEGSTNANGLELGDLESGKAPVFVYGRIYYSNTKIWGIPYLLSYAWDESPHPLYVIVAVSSPMTPRSIRITEVSFSADNGTAYSLPFDTPVEDDDFFTPIRDNKSVHAVAVLFPNAIKEPQSCRATIAGSVRFLDSAEVHPFEQTIQVPFSRKTYVYVGWMRLLYYQHF